MKRCTLLALFLLLFSCIMPAQAFPGGGMVKKGVTEAIEAIGKVVSGETSESAAKKVAREMAERLGREMPEIEALLSKYGDDLGIVLRNERRAKLFNELGDDAAQAFIRNGDAAESVLARIPSTDMAGTVARLSREDMRLMDDLVQKGRITPENSSGWLKAIQDKGDELLSFAKKHPIITTGALAAAWYALKEPGGALNVLNWLRTIAEFFYAHPYISLLIALLVGTLYLWCVQLLANSPWALARWCGSKLGGGLRRSVTSLFSKKKN